MDISNAVWKSSTEKIFNGVLLFSVAGVLMGLFQFIFALSWNAIAVKFLVFLLTGAASVVGYVIYRAGLTEMRTLTDGGEDSASIDKVNIAALLSMIGVCVTVLFSLIPVAGAVIGGVISGLLGIAASILCLIAFASLKKSAGFPASVLGGFSKLYVAYLLNVIAYGLYITVILALVAPLVSLVGFIFVLIGWNEVKNAK